MAQVETYIYHYKTFNTWTQIRNVKMKCFYLWAGDTVRLENWSHTTIAWSSLPATLTMECAARYSHSLTLNISWKQSILMLMIIRVGSEKIVALDNVLIMSKMRIIWISSQELRMVKEMVCLCWLMLTHLNMETIPGHPRDSSLLSLAVEKGLWLDKMVILILERLKRRKFIFRFLRPARHGDSDIYESYQNFTASRVNELLQSPGENVLHQRRISASLL